MEKRYSKTKTKSIQRAKVFVQNPQNFHDHFINDSGLSYCVLDW